MSPGGGLFSAPGCPGSIVSAATFHFRVRDENGWVRRALTTKISIVANPPCRSNRTGASGGPPRRAPARAANAG